MRVAKKTTKSLPLKTKGRSDAFDAHIGQKVRTIRALRNITQEELASAIGITFQQVQKYENGVNRISATRLYEIAKVLEVNVTSFFEGYEKDTVASNLLAEIENDKELALLIRTWQRIKSKDLKKTALKVLRTIVEGDEV